MRGEVMKAEERMTNASLSGSRATVTGRPAEADLFAPHIDAVARAAVAVSRESDVGRVAEVIVERAVALGAKQAYLHVRGPDGTLRLERQVGLPAEFVELFATVSPDTPLLFSRAARTGEVQVVGSRTELSSELVQTRCLLEQTQTHGIISTPLRLGEHVLGVLTWTFAQPHTFNPQELESLEAISEMFAVALDNARARQQLSAEIELRRKFELELDRRRLRLRAILDHAFEFIGLLDVEGRLEEANQTALDFIGARRQDCLGLYFWEAPWWKGPELEATRGWLKQAVAEAALGKFVRQELHLRDRHGQTVTIDFSLNPVLDASGEVVLLVPEGRDISERKLLERERQEWTSVVAHDLQQPVNNLALWVGILERRAAKAGLELGDARTHVRAGIERLARMVKDLLEISRLEVRSLNLQRSPLDLAELARVVAERTRAELPTVRVEAPSPVPRVEADAQRLEQVLTNLLTNAAKYGQAERPIVVRVEATEADVVVSVTNEGPGISPEELPHVFDRYYRGASETSPVAGLGLGLYVARSLVEAHGGRIWAESVPGQTTTFRFALPRLSRQAPSSG